MATTKYHLDTEQALGSGLKLCELNWQFTKGAKTDATGCKTVTLTSFAKIVWAGVGAAVQGDTAGRLARVHSITNNAIKLQFHGMGKGFKSSFHACAVATSIKTSKVNLVVLGYA